MLAVSQCQERGALAETARAHGGTYLFIYFLLLTFGLNFQTPFFNFKLNVSCNMQDIRKQEGRKSMLKQGFVWACTSFLKNYKCMSGREKSQTNK